MKSKIKKFVSGNILLYSFYFMTVRKRTGASINYFQKKTDLYIDGYPRSGNTFAFHLIKRSLPNVKCVHHLHVVAGIKIALLMKIPIFILCREPLESISSNYLMHYSMRNIEAPSNINEALIQNKIEMYIFYYSFVLKRKNRIDLISFNELIESPKLILNKINSKLGKSIHISDENINSITKSYKEKKKSDNLGGHIPNSQKELKKSEIKEFIRESEYYSELLSIYNFLNLD